jgi:hypothetical protein
MPAATTFAHLQAILTSSARTSNVKKFCALSTVACILFKLAFQAIAFPVASTALYPTPGHWPVINNVTIVGQCWCLSSSGCWCRCNLGKRNPSTVLSQRCAIVLLLQHTRTTFSKMEYLEIFLNSKDVSQEVSKLQGCFSQSI